MMMYGHDITHSFYREPMICLWRVSRLPLWVLLRAACIIETIKGARRNIVA